MKRNSSREILFVDGHSSDHTDDIIKKYSEVSLPTVKLVYENVGTMGYARNVGIEHSKGEVVAFTDGDAYPTKNWLESIVKVFSENDGQIVVGGMDILIPTIKTRDSITLTVLIREISERDISYFTNKNRQCCHEQRCFT